MKNTIWGEKENTLYIRTAIIMPKNCSREEYNKAFDLSYPERIKRYCQEDVRAEIENEIKNHPGCKISEFTYAY